MSDQARRCGTCRWWEFTDSTETDDGINHWGVCDVMYRDERQRSNRGKESCRRASTTRQDNGTDCPCWARKESDDAR